MQILESSVLGLRAARLTFASKVSGKTVTLFPMVHIGVPEFYCRVYKDALAHDVVLIEGFRSPIGRRITRGYRWIVGAKRLGLVVQPRLAETSNRRPRIISGDLSHDEFTREWRRVPFYRRIALYLAGPIYGIHQRWFGTVEGLARGHSMEDVLGRNEALNWTPALGAIDGALLGARDARLIERLSQVLAAPIDEVRSVAVVYGGAHMRAVIAELTRRRDYIAGDTEWLTVF